MMVGGSPGETNGKAWTMRMKSWHVSIQACGISALAWGQQGAELLPKAATSGPTLAETLQVQQTTLKKKGKFRCITRFHDSANGRIGPMRSPQRSAIWLPMGRPAVSLITTTSREMALCWVPKTPRLDRKSVV